MASEDSRYSRPLPGGSSAAVSRAIHRSPSLRAGARRPACIRRTDANRSKSSALRGSQWMFFEERHHDVRRRSRATLHGEAAGAASPMVDRGEAFSMHTTHTRTPRGGASSAGLDDRCLGDARTRAGPASRAGDPGCERPRSRSSLRRRRSRRSTARSTWPFLLIVRTGRIFTAHASLSHEGVTCERVPPDTRSFQHIASCIIVTREGQPRHVRAFTLGPL